MCIAFLKFLEFRKTFQRLYNFLFHAIFKYSFSSIVIMTRTLCKSKRGRVRKILKSGKCPAGTRKVRLTTRKRTGRKKRR